MAQPKFTWWPWRILAGLVGAGACLLPFFLGEFNSPEARREETAVIVALAVFSGGNAYILGTAIGDFGRTMMALLLAITIVSAVSFTPMEYGLLAPFLIVPSTTASLSLDRSLRGFAAAGALGLGALLIGVMMLGLSWLGFGLMLSVFLPSGAALIAAPFACAFGNAFMLGLLFSSAHRVRSPRARGGMEDEGTVEEEGSGADEEAP